MYKRQYLVSDVPRRRLLDDDGEQLAKMTTLRHCSRQELAITLTADDERNDDANHATVALADVLTRPCWPEKDTKDIKWKSRSGVTKNMAGPDPSGPKQFKKSNVPQVRTGRVNLFSPSGRKLCILH